MRVIVFHCAVLAVDYEGAALVRRQCRHHAIRGAYSGYECGLNVGFRVQITFFIRDVRMSSHLPDSDGLIFPIEIVDDHMSTQGHLKMAESLVSARAWVE